MKIGWIKQNSVGKQKLLKEKKYFAGNFKYYCLLHFTGNYHYHKNAKQLNNEKKQNKSNKACHVCYVNVWNTAYLISYIASCFKCIKNAQSLIVENSKTRELKYT